MDPRDSGVRQGQIQTVACQRGEGVFCFALKQGTAINLFCDWSGSADIDPAYKHFFAVAILDLVQLSTTL